MKGEIRVEAAAKINIGLEVGEPRPDGYHPILGIFQSVGIADELRVEASEGEGIGVEGRFDCAAESTTIYKATRLFLETTGERKSLRFSVEKRIPVMAGLGGGSADAAAAIVALDRLLETDLSPASMREIGSGVGADVPFFIPGGAAVVSGLGEIVQPIAPRLDLGIILAMPPFGVSTKWAYAELDGFRRRRGDSPRGGPAPRVSGADDASLASMFRGRVADWTFANSFEPMLREKYPLYGDLAELLGREGAQYSAITGSGACMYGVFPSFEAAQAARERLEAARRSPGGLKTLSGMVLLAVKPLETSIFLR
ncbi:4-(cytidine 5'-diphospho)-2-C-methyl-D-erythritol kinase [bacterium]|nr:4-(cytidine 5'-diphospho)-2-C-methyl-D-erythritol kinase [bacterium]